jgi:hypothetical protein
METTTWRVFYVLGLGAMPPEVDDVLLRAQALSRCRRPGESGLSVLTANHLVQLLEAPSETLGALLALLARSGNATLLLSEAAPQRWFGERLHGSVADPSLESLVGELAVSAAVAPGPDELRALAVRLASRIARCGRLAAQEVGDRALAAGPDGLQLGVRGACGRIEQPLGELAEHRPHALGTQRVAGGLPHEIAELDLLLARQRIGEPAHGALLGR